MDSSYEYLRECRIRHYQNMNKGRAMLLLESLKSRPVKAEFKKRINACKKRKFI